MLDSHDFSKSLGINLGKNPEKAERFQLTDEFEVDILQFNDRPYLGVNSAITNGVSESFPDVGLEFILTFNPATVAENIDVSAFVATYLQLYFLKNRFSIKIGDYFKVPGTLLRGYDFVGIYTTSPCYFPDDVFTSKPEVKYLWLVPIFETEFEFINKYGADKFESTLVSKDPDLSRFDRLPIF
jgi:hypothetical protein